MEIPNKIQKKAIHQYIDILKTKFKKRIKNVILFGSVARGKNKSDSDIDILVVTNIENRKINDEISMAAFDAIMETLVVISPLFMDIKTFNWYKKYNDPLYNNIVKDGINLWTKKLEY